MTTLAIIHTAKRSKQYGESNTLKWKWKGLHRRTFSRVRSARARVNFAGREPVYKYSGAPRCHGAAKSQGWKSCRQHARVAFPSGDGRSKDNEEPRGKTRTAACCRQLSALSEHIPRDWIRKSRRRPRLEVSCEWCAHVNHRASGNVVGAV